MELDDLLDGAATQHREVMHHESKGFNDLFKQINYLKGRNQTPGASTAAAPKRTNGLQAQFNATF